jgi:hypothetical protein
MLRLMKLITSRLLKMRVVKQKLKRTNRHIIQINYSALGADDGAGAGAAAGVVAAGVSGVLDFTESVL